MGYSKDNLLPYCLPGLRRISSGGFECEMDQEIQILLQIMLFDVPVNSENQLFVFSLKLESGKFDLKS